MAVVPVDTQPAAIVGITEKYCIFRLEAGLAVEPWSGVAVANVCPARPLLPEETVEIDRQNAEAVLLRELLSLQQFGLTEKQEAALWELTCELGGEH